MGVKPFRVLIRILVLLLVVWGSVLLIRLPLQLRLNRQVMEAVVHGNKTTVEHLLARGADINTRDPFTSIRNPWGRSLLINALLLKHSDIARLLIERGADIHVRDSGEHTALTYALDANDLPNIRRLLARGADPNRRSSDGSIELWSAHSTQALTLLLDSGANPNLRIRGGMTTLMYRCQ